MIGKMIEVPKNTDVSIEVTKSIYKEIDGYHMYPVQRPTYDEDELFDTSDEFVIDKEVYLKDTFFPQKISAINDKSFSVIRGHRVLSLKINPVHYNPVTKKTRIYYDLDVKVKYDQIAKIEPVNERIHSYEFEKMLDSHILNHEGLVLIDPERNPSDTGCDYLILTTREFYNPQDPNNPIVRFKQWKEQKGLTTWVKDVSNMKADAIKIMMQTIYDTWDPVPEYLLIVGDVEFVPTNYFKLTLPKLDDNNETVYITKHWATDLSYIQLDGDDWHPDMMMGRLSVDTLDEANITIAKIINYEKNPPKNDDFYHKSLLVGLFQDEYTYELNGTRIVGSDGISENIFIKNLEEIRPLLLLPEGNEVDRIYKATGGSSPAYYRDGTSLPLAIQDSNGFPWHWSTTYINQMIQSKINEGRFLVDFRGHGGCIESGDWSGFFNQNGINSLKNDNLTPVVFSITCSSGFFDTETYSEYKSYASGLYGKYSDYDPETGRYYYVPSPGCNSYVNKASKESFSEVFLKHQNGGAVAVIGASRGANPPCTQYINHQLVKLTMSSQDTIGSILNSAKVYMDSQVDIKLIENGDDLYAQVNGLIFHLFGDPEMSIHTHNPHTISEPNSYEDEQHLWVEILDMVSVKSAVVTLMQNGVFIASKRINEEGKAMISLENLGRGTYDVSVTAPNSKPYFGEITVNRQMMVQ